MVGASVLRGSTVTSGTSGCLAVSAAGLVATSSLARRSRTPADGAASVFCCSDLRFKILGEVLMSDMVAGLLGAANFAPQLLQKRLPLIFTNPVLPQEGHCIGERGTS